MQQGQALWKPRRGYPELAGELIMANDTQGRCYLQFSKTPMSLVSAQTTPDQWLIQFPPRGWSFSGHGRPPSRFAWLYLPSALRGENLPPFMRFQRKPDGGWRLENARSGETVEGFFSP